MEIKWIFNTASSFNKLWNRKSIWKWTKIYWSFFQEIICLKKIKHGVYVINLDEYKDGGTHWIALFCKRNENVYFNSFGVEHIPVEIKEFIGNKNIKANIFRVQASNLVMCGCFCYGFLDYKLSGEKLTDFTSLFSPHNFDKNDNIILSCFKYKWNR